MFFSFPSGGPDLLVGTVAAGTMGVYFQNFTRYCTDDTWGKGVDAQSGPADLAPALDKSFIPRLGPRTRLASSSAELAALLRDPSIDGIRLISANVGPVASQTVSCLHFLSRRDRSLWCCDLGTGF